MNIFSWNVNGIRAVEKKGAFKEFFESTNPDIACFQETKISADQVQKENFDDKYPKYHKFWSFAARKGYSGTAIWSKIKPLRILRNFSNEFLGEILTDAYGDATSEGRICAAEFPDFWLLTVYTPNAKSELERLELRQKWDAEFLKFAKKLESGELSSSDFAPENVEILSQDLPENFKKKPVIFCGDLNVAHQEIDLARPKQNRRSAGFTDEERAGISQILSQNFVDTFRNFYPEKGEIYTWWSYLGGARKRNVGWRIDYFVASRELLGEKITDAAIHDQILGSDHCPVSIKVAKKA